MKQDKDIVAFFNHYSEQMLPKDGEQFMEQFKQNLELLPVPDAFHVTEPDLKTSSTQWLLQKMAKDYQRSKQDAVIACVLTCVALAATFLVVSLLDVWGGCWVFGLVVALGIGMVAMGFIYATTPLQTKIF